MIFKHIEKTNLKIDDLYPIFKKSELKHGDKVLTVGLMGNILEMNVVIKKDNYNENNYYAESSTLIANLNFDEKAGQWVVWSYSDKRIGAIC